MVYKVSELNRYPIKSMGRVVLQEAVIDRFGVEKDRRWMLIDKKGQFLSQRKVPEMSLLSVTDLSSGNDWSIVVRGKADDLQCNVGEHFSNGSVGVKVWSDQCEALVANDEVNHWFSEELGVECRLVFMDDQYHRLVDPNYAKKNETVSFADGFPILLTTQASLDAFNQHLPIPIDMVRFRPNIVVEGCEPYEEDSWKRVRIGSIDFEVVKPCSRCAIPTINPTTAKKEPEVFAALRQHRSVGKSVFFGQNLLAVGEGSISVGDDVSVLE